MSNKSVNQRRPGGGPGGRHGNGNFEKAKNFRKTLIRLMSYFGRDAILLMISFVFILANVILSTLAPAILGNAITEHLEKQPDIDGFISQVAVLLVIYSAAFIASVLSGITVSFMSNRVIKRMRTEGFHHVQRLSISYFDKKGIGDIISRLTNDIDMVFQFMSNGFTSTVSAFFSLTGIIIAMLVLNIPLTLAVLATLPVIGILIAVIGRRVRKSAKNRQTQVGALTASIEESVSGMKVIQSFHREKEKLESFRKVNRSATDASIKMATESYMMMPVMQLVNVFGLVFVIGVGGALTVADPAVYSIGLLTAFIVYARKFFEPMRQIAQVYNMIQSALAGAERVFEVFDSTEELPEPENPKTAEGTEGRVSFEDVSFSYDGTKKILDGISFNAAPGEVTAVVGPTGAGKTTVINLLARFYDAQSGSIKIDGVDLRDYGRDSLRKLLGIVLQEPFFFAASIRENLLYGKPDASGDELIEAAKLANAHHFISCLPDGYDTVLTERGMNLSQGERQLLAITRTILTDPAILILDEATSSIDSLTEVQIQKGLLHLMEGRTSFVVAHRLSTIKNADRILVVHDHKIIEEGTHDQLMNKGGFYSKLYSIQFSRPEIDETSRL